MIENSRSLLAFRKSLIKLLTDKLGYRYKNMRDKSKSEHDLNAWVYGPRVSWDLFSYLEMINMGEAHYRVDMPASIMEHLGDEVMFCEYRNQPSKRTPHEARELAYELLQCGYEFEIKKDECGYNRRQGGQQFGVVQYINWLDAQANHFCVHEAWRGVRNDGVAWDMAPCHQVYAVKAAARHLVEGEDAGYAVLAQSDEELRPYPFETNYETTRRLFADYVILSDVLNGVEEGSDATVQFVVEPRLSPEALPGQCIYRPETKLKSPLANLG